MKLRERMAVINQQALEALTRLDGDALTTRGRDGSFVRIGDTIKAEAESIASDVFSAPTLTFIAIAHTLVPAAEKKLAQHMDPKTARRIAEGGGLVALLPAMIGSIPVAMATDAAQLSAWLALGAVNGFGPQRIH